MNSLKPKQLLVFDALLLEQPFFELHPRHHQSRRHYFHPQNHVFHSENSFLIYFFFSSQLRGPELGIKCHQRAKSHPRRGFPHEPLYIDVEQTFPMLSTVKLLSMPSSSLNEIPILGNTGLSNVNLGKDEPG